MDHTIRTSNRRRTASLSIVFECGTLIPALCAGWCASQPQVWVRPCNGGAWTRVRCGLATARSNGAGIQRSVRKKSLYSGDTSDTNLSAESGQAVNVHVIDEWAKVATQAPGTSEARMSRPVGPSVLANSDHCNSKSSSIGASIPSAGSSQAHPSRDQLAASMTSQRRSPPSNSIIDAAGSSGRGS
jgi:hypothetical protein